MWRSVTTWETWLGPHPGASVLGLTREVGWDGQNIPFLIHPLYLIRVLIDPRGTLWYTPHSVGRPSENFKQDSELIRSALKTSFWMESVKWIGQKCTGHFWCRELMPRPQVAGWGSNTNDDGLTRVVATGWTEVPDIYFGQYLSVSVPLSHHNLRAMFSKFYYQNKRVFFFFKRRLLET